MAPEKTRDRPIGERGCAKASLTICDLALGGGVVGVDLRRLAVGVPEELLDRAQRLTGGGETRGERVAQIMKLDLAHAGGAARRP